MTAATDSTRRFGADREEPDMRTNLHQAAPTIVRPGRRYAAAFVAMACAVALAACGDSADGAQTSEATSSIAAGSPQSSTPRVQTNATAEPDRTSEQPSVVGTYARTITVEDAEAAGTGQDFITDQVLPDGLAITLEFTDEGNWTLSGDFCKCGVFQRGDFGTYVFDQQGRLVITSLNTESRGKSAMVDWTMDGDTLVIASAGGLTPDGEVFDPIETVMTLGTYTRVAEGGDTVSTLRVGATPGWDSELNALTVDLQPDLRLEIDHEWIDANVGEDIEQRIVDAVASGELDVGYLGTRALSALGVDDFDVLTAPWLVDSYELQQAVLDSAIPSRLLGELDALGVSGLAIAAGPLRYPLGIDRPFVDAGDFAGVTFHTYPAPIGSSTAEALGASHSQLFGQERDQAIDEGSIDVTENSLLWLSNNGRGSYVTLDAMWPATGVLIVNSKVLDGLTVEQADAFRSAAATSLRTPVELAEEEARLVDELCAAGKLFVATSQADRETLEDAVQPVYRSLSANPDTAALLAEITDLKATIQPTHRDIPANCSA
jgi:TRAP-type C4-dicarboxylate transport system substrate-binding protein